MEKFRGPFHHVAPPPQAGRGAPVRRDKRRGIFLPGRSPYPAQMCIRDRILKEYMRKGFALDDERLKNLGGGGYFKELLERIRDIRASEKVFYRQVLEIYATSIDYDPKEMCIRDRCMTSGLTRTSPQPRQCCGSRNTHWQRRPRERKCIVSGYCAVICIFWSIGRCSTHPKRRRILLMTALWKPARCSIISRI